MGRESEHSELTSFASSLASWEKGYGDMEFALDFDTVRLLGHLPATAMIQCDLVWLDHKPVVQSPARLVERHIDATSVLMLFSMNAIPLVWLRFVRVQRRADRMQDREDSIHQSSSV